ncbi:uncharacterized protein MONOS_18601 [Monocercomonoides exilis]|uniref:uncharacterized protein n=1 Tax=Monocercomonoides exilis TaxID=2049356 RepID=UPI00355AB392|nr:hypothetical protein MONOS_18601 [Monocercomonoides exilis]
MRTMSMMQYQTEKSDEYYTSGEKEREARMKSELTELFDLYDLDSLQHTSPESKRKEARRKKREMEEEEAHFQELQKQKQREEERRRRREEIRMNGGDPNELLSQKSSLTPRSPLSPMCGGSSSSSGSGGGGGGGGGGSGDSSYFPSTPSGAGAWPNALQRYPSQFTPSKTRSYKSQTARSAGATYRSKDGEAPSRNIPNVEELNQRNQNFLHDWAEEEQMRLERERRQSFLRESDVLMSFGSAQKKEKESFDILRELEEKKKVQREKTPADIVDEMLRRADGTMSPPSLSGITSASASHSPSHSASPRSFSHSSSVSPSRLNIHSSQDLSASAVLNAEGADGSSSAIPLNSSLSASSSLSQLSSTLSSSAAAAANGVVLEYADENDTSVVSIAKQTRMLIREQLHLPVHVPLMKRQHDIAIQRQREAQDMKLLEDEMKEKEKEKEGEEDRAGGTHHTEMLSQQKKEDDEEFLKKLLEEDEFAHSIAPQDRTGTDASKLRSNIPLPVLDAATSLILPPSGSPATAASHQNTQQSSLQLRQSNPASINRPMAHLKQAPSEASLPPARKEAQTLPESLRQTDASCVVLPSYPSASFIEPSSLEDTALLGPVTIISSHPSSPNNNRDRREKGNGASQEGEGVEGERGGNAGENGFISAHDDELDSFLSIRDD